MWAQQLTHTSGLSSGFTRAPPGDPQSFAAGPVRHWVLANDFAHDPADRLQQIGKQFRAHVNKHRQWI